MSLHPIRRLAACFAVWILIGAMGVAWAAGLREWQETRVIDGQRMMLNGRQLTLPDGSERTVYHKSDGTPMDETFIEANQIRWGGQAISVQSGVSRPEPRRGGTPAVQPKPRTAGMALDKSEVLRATLPALAMAPIIAEDEQEARKPEKGLVRIGVGRPLEPPIHVDFLQPRLNAWRTGADGVKTIVSRLESEGATGLRVEIADLALPKGGVFYAYNTDNAEEYFGPFDAATLDGEESFWTPTIFSPRVSIEVQIPPEVDLANVRFTIPQVSHIYRTGPSLQAEDLSCDKDLNCFPEWDEAGRAVARMILVRSGDSFYCTGSLLNDLKQTASIPYFMTAYHCVSNNTIARTVEFYWLYETNRCNGSAPAASTVPRTTGGADFLAGSAYNNGSGNDFSFLRIRNNVPAGLTYLGWTTQLPFSNDELACIHHPDGSYKRISFGNAEAFSSIFLVVYWDLGVTHPGSSGSPLLNPLEQFVGHLYGGFSDCNNQDREDSFGRFDKSYPVIAQYLGSASNDNFSGRAQLQGNSGQVTAANWSATLQSNEPEIAGEEGGASLWWYWIAPGRGRMTINTFGSNFDTLLGVYTGGLLTTLVNVAQNDDADGSQQSQVSFTTSAGAQYQIKVDGFDGDTGTIKLNWSYEPQEPGTVKVTIGPFGAVNAGAQWRLDGGTYRNSGDTQTNVAFGQHALEFKPIFGYATPVTQTINMGSGQNLTFNVGYVPYIDAVIFSPPQAINPGTQLTVVYSVNTAVAGNTYSLRLVREGDAGNGVLLASGLTAPASQMTRSATVQIPLAITPATYRIRVVSTSLEQNAANRPLGWYYSATQAFAIGSKTGVAPAEWTIYR